MELPFTADQFFQVFADYNRLFLPVAVGLWCCTLASLLVGRRHRERSGRLLSAWLAALWAWNGLAYHAWLFTGINPAAWLFAATFLAQAVLFAIAAARRPPKFFSATGAPAGVGLALIVYALVYPALTIASGHPYPFAPTFGVPCPTTLLTIGLFLTVRGRPVRYLAVVPFLWALIGGSAAVLLGVVTDYVLLLTGVLGPIWLFVGHRT